MQPAGLRESSRWSARSEDHRYRVIPACTLKGCQISLRESCTPFGVLLLYFHAFRWCSLRFDHRLLSRSPSGCLRRARRLISAHLFDQLKVRRIVPQGIERAVGGNGRMILQIRGRTPNHRLITGKSIHDAFCLLRAILIVGTPVSGMRGNVSLSAPAIASRRQWPFLIRTEVGCKANLSSAICPGTSGIASCFLNE